MLKNFNLISLLLFCLMLVSLSFGQVKRETVPPIKLGVTIESDFAAGAAPTFALHLESNQFAAVVLNQKGANLILTVDDAQDNKPLQRIDVNFSDFGYDRVLLESGDQPRDLLIRVSPQLARKAATAKFSLALVELKTADARDRQRIDAQKAILDAVSLLLDEKKESKFQGFFVLGNALKLARESGDQVLEATALILMERVYLTLGDFKKAIEYGNEALPLVASPENSYFELIIKDAMIPALTAMNELQKSAEMSQEVIEKAEKLGDRRLVMSSLNNLTWANNRANDVTKNIEYAEKALQIAEDLEDTITQAELFRSMGSTYSKRSDFGKSNEALNKALALSKANNNQNAVYTTYIDFSDNYTALGQYQKAIDFLQLALEGYRRTNVAKNWEELILSRIAGAYSAMGQNARALEYNRQALEISSKFNYKLGNILGLLTKGRIYAALNDYEKSKTAYTEASKLAEQIQDQSGIWNSYINLGFMEQKFGHPEAALEFRLKALETRKSLKIEGGEENLANLYLELGQTEKAAEVAARSLERSRATGDRITESNELYSLARVRRVQKDLPAALKLIEDSLKIVESVRSDLINQEFRASYLSTARYKYDFYISLLVEMQNQANNKDFGALAFAASERARARGLLDLLAESNTDISNGISPELKERERGIEAKLSALQTQLIKLKSAENADEKRVADVQKEIEKTDNERETLQTEIRRSNSRYAELKYPATIDLRQTQTLLDDQTVLLEYQTGADASFLFAVGKKEFQIIKLPSEKTLRASIETLHKSIATPARTELSNYLATGRDLYQTLLAPIENLLKTKKKIIVAADGALHYLPFEALLRNDTQTSLDKLPYLVRDFEISYTPSASVLANLKSRDEAAKPAKSFLAFAAPDYGAKAANGNNETLAAQTTRSILGENRTWNLTDLQFAKTEAESIAKLFPAGQAAVFTGADATETRVKSSDLLSQYRYLHFAVHGLIDEEQPQFSSLVLSLPKASDQSTTENSAANKNPKSEEDGLLQTPEIFNLRLRTDLVTLSACETGLGQELRGEGIVGLTRAFFYAGTPSVLVSLWKVDDASTADLMTLFYENLRKNGARDKAAALRETQLKLIAGNRYSHPYFWSSFILQGKTN